MNGSQRKRRYNPIIGLALVVAVLGHLGAAQAQEVEIDSGVNWLVGQQGIDGLWLTGNDANMRDCATALQALGTAAGDSSALVLGLEAIGVFDRSIADHLARYVAVHARYAVGGLDQESVSSLVADQNADGGWGFAAGYPSNVLDTVLALHAIESAAYADPSIAANAVSYLTGLQNPDGSWAFVDGDAGSTHFTLQVMLGLTAVQDEIDVAASLAAAVTWIEGQANPDGGFGESASNAGETALALAVLILADASSPAIAGAESWLYAAQTPAGSWNDDVYATAQAVLALSKVGPDVSVGETDIVLSNPTPSDLEVVTISVTIRNRGVHPVADIRAGVHDGDPDLGGTQIGNDIVISTLAAGADSTVQVAWDTTDLGGDHQIHAVAEPDGMIAETNKSNNTGIRFVHVDFPPDLLIGVDDISFIPENPQPGESVTISTRVHNWGDLPAANVSLMIYDGDPGSGGIPLLTDPFVFPSIAPSGNEILNLNMGTYYDTEGSFVVTAVADVEGTIREISEANNSGADILWVGVQCAVTAVDNGLNLLGIPLQPNGETTAFATMDGIDNSLEVHGWEASTQTWRSAFDLGGGTVLGDDFSLQPMQGFFARTSAAGDANFCGITAGPDCIDLYPGLNLVSVPYADACYSGYRFLDVVTDCSEAHAWDASTQSWRSAADVGGVPTGDDFEVNPGNGYFVNVASSGNWCTTYCDTISNLPDLVITPASIYLLPNPVVSGGSVNIWVSMANEGTEPVSNPRLDIYAGDPAAGGTLLAWFNIPETIPAGGASGYWGNSFPLSGTGSVEIWAVADILNEVPELDEGNNRDFNELFFTSAGIAAESDQAPEARGTAALRIRPRRLADGTAPPLPTLEPRLATKPLPGSGTEKDSPIPGVATEITNVLAANVSSSAATIYWATDNCVDGTVFYGSTTALGSSAAQVATCSDLHGIQLADLTPETTYYFAIDSGDLWDDNGGAMHSFTTSPVGGGLPAVVTGQVYEHGCLDPIPGAMVWAELEHEGATSAPLATFTDTNGNWLLNLGNFKSSVDGSVLPWSAGDTITVNYLDPRYNFGTPSALSSQLTGSSPQDVGAMCAVDWVSANSETPSRPYLQANFPNPFNPSTTIRFGLTRPGAVDLAIYDVTGRRIVSLVQQTMPAGRHEVVWEGRDQSGRQVASGLYFYRLQTEELREIKKMMLVK